jgi:hypothetical protein
MNKEISLLPYREKVAVRVDEGIVTSILYISVVSMPH